MEKNGKANKLLYSNTENGVQISINLKYNPKTDYIGIYTNFLKSSGWHSGIINNKNCPNYLGVTVAERVLSKVFKNVERMPNNNPGYDFICNKGYKIDVKSSTKIKNKNKWTFKINHNRIADYFICMAFDDRKNLNPLHIWLIPSKEINHLETLTISESKVDKWNKYELFDKLNKVIICCNMMKNN